MRTFFVCDDSFETMVDYTEVRGKKPFVPLVSKQETLNEIKAYMRNGIEPIFVVDLQMGDDSDAGFDIIRAIRKKDALKKAPIIVVSTASEQETINQTYELGANAYIQKSDNGKRFRRSIADMYAFWDKIDLHDRHKLERIKKPRNKSS